MQQNRKELPRALGYLLPYWHLELFALVCSMVTSGLELVNPWINKLLIDDVIAGRNIWMLKIVCLCFIGAVILKAIFATLRGYLFTYIGERAVIDMRAQLFSHLQRLSLSYFSREKTGGIMSIFTSNVPAMQTLYTSTLVDFVIDILRFAVTLSVMVRIDWQLTLIALPALPLFVASLKFFSRPGRRISRKIQDANALLSGNLQETISGVRTVKAFTQEQSETHRFLQMFQILLGLRLRENILGNAIDWVSELIAILGTVLALFLGGMKAIDGDMQLGVLVAFVIYLGSLYEPVTRFTHLNTRVQSAMGAAERVFGFLDTISQVQDREDAKVLPQLAGRIQFEDVFFTYEDGEQVLKRVNLTVEPGERIALVGASGCGKSTLISLLIRFYDPSSGRILVDGYDLRDVTMGSLRQQIGAVFQDVFLFSTTVEENIRLGRVNASFEEVVAAAKAGNAHDFIVALPKGYKTEVGERGVKLSGGQKQRISIARALLRDPRILVLDEATSALDSESEEAVNEALRGLAGKCTILTVAHRLSTVKQATRIIVLDRGEIAEVGTHDQLLAMRGIYRKLHDMQFRPSDERSDCSRDPAGNRENSAPDFTTIPTLHVR